MIETNLRRLEGVKTAKMGKDKFHYDINILETKSLLPFQIEELCKKLEDYTFRGFEITAISGTAERAGDAYTFIARGSKLKYDLKANEALRKLVTEGRTTVTVAGAVTQEKGKPPVIEVSNARESAK